MKIAIDELVSRLEFLEEMGFTDLEVKLDDSRDGVKSVVGANFKIQAEQGQATTASFVVQY